MDLNRIGNSIPWLQVTMTEGFWEKRLKINRKVTILEEYEQCKKSGRVDSVKCIYDKERDTHSLKGVVTIDGVLSENMSDGGIPRPHHYWDSDLAKWIEAAAYSLKNEYNQELEKKIDAIVDDFEILQKEDGYLNTYYTVVEPGMRWSNVYRMHELYCAGHLIEAAIAYYQATNKRKFLDIVCRFADHIERMFGPEKEKIQGYPGHQEIELALIKLYRITKERKYLALSKFFLDERGKKPYFFEEEAKMYGRDVEDGGPKGILGKSFLKKGPYALFQSHLPIRDQESAEGHAVRVTYMGCGMADVVAETGDEGLWEACIRLWDSVTKRRMYITGGIGSQDGCERFNFDYQLPNEESYNETCASVGLVMWANRMLQICPDNKYADIMERALYNGVISGVSLEGNKFFYANHLAAHPEVFQDRIITNPRMLPVRQDWFPVSCCPMNLARLTESIGGYFYTQVGEDLYVHLFAANKVEIEINHTIVYIEQSTLYPWNGKIQIKVMPQQSVFFNLSIRIPGWCHNYEVKLNNEEIITNRGQNGYITLSREWGMEEIIELEFEVKPILMESYPEVRMNCGKVAIQCGPLIYCLEEVDNKNNVFELYVGKNSQLRTEFHSELLGGVAIIKGKGWKKEEGKWENELYHEVIEQFKEVEIIAVPYYAWSNRAEGKMTVWINDRQNI